MRFSPLFLLFLLLRPASSAPLPAFEGTLSQTRNGLTTRAKIAWLPPDTLRVETLPDAPSATPAGVTLARGEETLALETSTGRVRRAPWNIARQWWRGAGLEVGGPANFLFAGTSFTPQDAANGRFFLRDKVIFGGGGRDVYYAAQKVAARRFAAQIAITPTSRFEKDERGQTSLDAKIILAPDGLPRAATVVAGGETVVFAYDLKPAQPQIAEISAPILEAATLQAPSAYVGNDASTLFNRGAALAQNEDAPGAIAALEAAQNAAPESSAPPLALFEIAFALRDAPRAQKALDALANLPIASPEIEVRRARLALLNRDRAGARAALQLALDDAPQNPNLALALAEVARSLGDFEAARTLYRAVLVDSPLPAAQVAAAQNLALGATFDEIPSLLASIPSGNDAQKLARALLQLRAGEAPETESFSNDDLQTALALGFERAARDEAAQNSWQTLEERAPDDLKNTARAHLMTLAARRGDVGGAIKKWRDWNANLTLPSDREAAQNAFLGAFQKAFRSDALQTSTLR